MESTIFRIIFSASLGFNILLTVWAIIALRWIAARKKQQEIDEAGLRSRDREIIRLKKGINDVLDSLEEIGGDHGKG